MSIGADESLSDEQQQSVLLIANALGMWMDQESSPSEAAEEINGAKSGFGPEDPVTMFGQLAKMYIKAVGKIGDEFEIDETLFVDD